MSEEHTKKPYVPVLIALAVITAIEITIGLVFDSSGDGTINQMKLSILLVIALIKASTIVAFYMHVKYEKRPWLLVALVFGIPLFILMPIAMLPALT